MPDTASIPVQPQITEIIVTRIITIMPVRCQWALSPVTHQRTLETLIINYLQAYVSLMLRLQVAGDFASQMQDNRTTAVSFLMNLL